jgi:hypothetical protein
VCKTTNVTVKQEESDRNLAGTGEEKHSSIGSQGQGQERLPEKFQTS